MTSEARSDRAHWVAIAERLATPVLEAAARHGLRASMPVETGPTGSHSERAAYSHLEAIARLLFGLAPWLELGQGEGSHREQEVRLRLRAQAQHAIRAGCSLESPDRFEVAGPQSLVEASFLALAMKRAPSTLWWGMDHDVQEQFVRFLVETRRILPHHNNWLLFSAAIEAFLHMIGESSWDRMRIDAALRRFDGWHRGDGVYSDGPHLRTDYYNSFVIQPYLLEITDVVGNSLPRWQSLAQDFQERAGRYAEVLERHIGPDGSVPPLGRSLTYRAGVLHILGLLALRDELPASLPPGQVRSAMSASLNRMLDPEGTYDVEGWLQIGLYGYQPSLAERYISTGSLYLTSTALVPLGAPASAAFWSDPAQDWTSRQLLRGTDLPADLPFDKR